VTDPSRTSASRPRSTIFLDEHSEMWRAVLMGDLNQLRYFRAVLGKNEWDGIVDKFVGDEVVALFVPGFAGERHAERAVEAARALLEETGNRGDEPWIPVGAGVHTGIACVGRVGEGDACDFTAVGDAVNTTARLASSAGAGEILVSKAAADASMLDAEGLESRTLTLRGKDEMIETLVLAAA
jgi:adenylate cyclase